MIPSKIGDKIKILRSAKGWTQKDLAEKLDCSESLISYVEKGERNLSIKDIQSLAHIFNISMNFFSNAQSDLFRADPREITEYDLTEFKEHLNNNHKVWED